VGWHRNPPPHRPGRILENRRARGCARKVRGQLGQVTKQGETPTDLNLTESKRGEMGYLITDGRLELPVSTEWDSTSRLDREYDLRGRPATL